MKLFLLLALLPFTLAAKRDVYGAPLATECNVTAEMHLVVVVRPPAEVQRLYTSNAHGDATAVLAFFSTGPDGRQVVVLPPLRGQDDAETMRVWGHELAHLVCGRFHGDGAAY